MDLRERWRVINEQGTDLTQKLAPHLNAITVTDAPGRRSDTATLKVEGAVDLPEVSQGLRISLGNPLVDCGEFLVSRYEVTEQPSGVSIICRSAHFGGSDSERGKDADEARFFSYESVTLGDVTQSVAARLGLLASVDDQFSSFAFDYLEQDGETDPAFIDRVATRAGAVVKFTPTILAVGSEQSVSSYTRREPLRNLDVTRDMLSLSGVGVSYDVRHVPGSHVARWHNTDTGEQGQASTGTGKPRRRVRGSFSTEAQAAAAATAAQEQRARRKRVLTLPFSDLDARIWTGTGLTIRDLSAPFLGEWVAREVTHVNSTSESKTTVRATERKK